MLTRGVSGEATKDEAWGALLVAKGSGIRTAKDLERRTVAVNTINHVPHMVVLRSPQEAGADWHRVKVIEVGFAEPTPRWRRAASTRRGWSSRSSRMRRTPAAGCRSRRTSTRRPT